MLAEFCYSACNIIKSSVVIFSPFFIFSSTCWRFWLSCFSCAAFCLAFLCRVMFCCSPVYSFNFLSS